MTENSDSAPSIDPRFYTLREAAAILAVHPSTISRACADGKFPHVRIGKSVRIPVAEVERLEAGEPARAGVLDVPDYTTGTPSVFDGAAAPTGSRSTFWAPSADGPEDVDE